MAGRTNSGHNRLYHAAKAEVERSRSSASLGSDPIEVLQELLDGWVADLRYAQSKVDGLPEDEVFRQTAQGTVANEWIRLRDRYREELERASTNLVRSGIADRAVRIREAQAVLFVHAVQDAASDAGIPLDQVRALGQALRRRVNELDAVRDAAADIVQAGAATPALPQPEVPE